MRGRVGDEVGEQHRLVVWRELVVEDRRVACCNARSACEVHLVALRAGLDDRRQQRPRLRDPLAPARPRAQMPAQHLAGDLAQVPAGQDVVGDVGDAVRRQVLAAGGEQGVARRAARSTSRRRGRSRSRTRRARQRRRGRRARTARSRAPSAPASAARPLDRVARQVDAAERAAGQPVGHRHEVAAVAAPELEHAGRRPAAPARSPNSVATVARRSGCVCANGWPGYGTRS